MRLMVCKTLLTIVAALFAARVTSAVDKNFFAEQIAPILQQRCFECHNDLEKSGGFSLQSASSARAGGDSGPVILPGKPEDSYLVRLITLSEGSAEMPQDAEPLSEDEVALIRDWIARGANWPNHIVLHQPRVTDTDWWSLQPMIRRNVPNADSQDAWRVVTPIDAFVIRKLEEHGLSLSNEADPLTLVRRLYYDLIGLPPTPAELNHWVSRLNSSRSRSQIDDSAYADLVDHLLASPRYGERWARHWLDVVHYGDTHGYDKDKLRPNAWPYRDYVIRAFNDDRPYARFIKEQVAGDVLYPEQPKLIAATGFLVAGPWDFIGHVEVPASKIDGRIARNLDRDDMVTNTLQTFTSLTVQCARCHHHKFDPITQEDYYSLQAVFAAIGRNDRPMMIKTDKQSPDSQQLVYAAATQFKPEGNHHPTGGKPVPIHVLHRGMIDQHLRLVGPGTLRLRGDLPSRFALPADHEEGERRIALAEWLADPRNPLTWRSIVNRIWLYHFGRGIVNSPNDFGRMGQLPTHPELLDWLATEFRDGGAWITIPQSVKQLHKLIVTSAVYRQSSAHNVDDAKIDASNQFYWRANRRRLEAEAVRDAVLCAAGKLDLKMYGPGFQDFVLEQTDHSPQFMYDQYDPNDATTHRRSIYRFLPRSQPQPFMQTLDCADPSQQVAKRDETVTALSALAMLNNKLMVCMAEHLATHLEAKYQDRDAQIEFAFESTVSRRPTSEERIALTEHAAEFGLASACRVILNLNEFVFVD